MIRFRRQPTLAATIGSLFFTGYSLVYFPILPILVATALISIFFLFVEPIPQPQSYHNFADKRLFLCSCHVPKEGLFLPPGTKRSRYAGVIIPHFGDVVSNIVIFIGGIWGLAMLYAGNSDVELGDTRRWQLQICLPVFFLSTTAISFGSSYYHWDPNDMSLVWDRLPMTLAFVSIFCFMLEEYMPSHGIGRSLMPRLLILGIFSVMYWRHTDDLRLYVLVQFLPLIAIAVMLIWYDPLHGGKGRQAVALLCYAVAKVCEERDYQIFQWTNRRVSGHTLKHVLAGLASISIASVL